MKKKTDDDLDAAVLRLAHAVAGLHQQARFAATDGGDGSGRNAELDQREIGRAHV